ncbi:MAG: hypothetical protein ACOCXT_02015 [Candidatus Dojkabacteria bacterium]
MIPDFYYMERVESSIPNHSDLQVQWLEFMNLPWWARPPLVAGLLLPVEVRHQLARASKLNVSGRKMSCVSLPGPHTMLIATDTEHGHKGVVAQINFYTGSTPAVTVESIIGGNLALVSEQRFVGASRIAAQHLITCLDPAVMRVGDNVVPGTGTTIQLSQHHVAGD